MRAVKTHIFRVVLSLGLVAVLSACSNPFSTNRFLKAQVRAVPTSIAQTSTSEFKQYEQSPLSRYAASGDFKALASNAANNASRVQGASVGEGSLFVAERKALKDCTRNSDYQGECEIIQIGSSGFTGSDIQKDRQRWTYVQAVHQNLARQTPLRTPFRAKVLAPASKVGDATFWLSSSFATGGYAAVQMSGYTCTGTLDPIEADRRDEQDADKPLGLMEMACQNGQLLYGGYATVDQQTQLLFLEDTENERWEFMISNRSSSVGYDTFAFKKLFELLRETE
ncbi:MAG: hypothetical protein ACPGVN_07910 [Alphaproteobacteria bacterium]